MENILAIKSSENLKAAEFLIEPHRLFAPSIHCSYYACVQLIHHILYTESGAYNLTTTDGKSAQMNKELGRIEGEAYHPRLVRAMQRTCLQSAPAPTVLLFSKSLKDLRNLRVDSDYYDVEVDENLSKNALDKSKKICAILNFFNKPQK